MLHFIHLDLVCPTIACQWRKLFSEFFSFTWNWNSSLVLLYWNKLHTFIVEQQRILALPTEECNLFTLQVKQWVNNNSNKKETILFVLFFLFYGLSTPHGLFKDKSFLYFILFSFVIPNHMVSDIYLLIFFFVYNFEVW